MKRVLTVSSLVMCAALSGACTTAESEWQKTTAANTVTAYKAFLDHYPNNEHATLARDRMSGLADDIDWAAAQRVKTRTSYSTYLQKHGAGEHVREARGKVAALDRAAAWKKAQAIGDEQAVQAFLAEYPQGPEADEAKKLSRDAAASACTAFKRAHGHCEWLGSS